MVELERENLTSFTAKYLVETAHQVDVLNGFQVIFRNPMTQLLRFAKSVADKHTTPTLCRRKIGDNFRINMVGTPTSAQG